MKSDASRSAWVEAFLSSASDHLFDIMSIALQNISRELGKIPSLLPSVPLLLRVSLQRY